MPLKFLLRDTPQEKLDWQVSSSDLAEIAKKLSQWRLLAPHLQVTPEQEKEIVRGHPSNLQLQSLKCLQKWSHDQDSKATYGALISALYRVENIDLIYEICTLLSTQAFPSPPPDRTLHEYANVLRDSYARMKLPGIFEALTGDDEDGPAPSERYINLVMTNRERIQRGGVDKEHMELALRGDTSGMADCMSKKNLKVHIDVCDLFTLDNKEYKVILIEGAPGSGKTTLLRYITQKWGSGELFCQFSLVLLIQLRDVEVQKAKCLADLIPFVFDPDKIQEIAKKIALRNGKGVLLLFDGLPTEKQSESVFRDIIRVPQKHSLSKAAVLVSARQITSANKQQYVTTRIEILGFTPEQIEMYVKESLPDKEANKLMATIKDDPVLQGNCYLPLSTAIITHTYICMGHALPATFCRIIMELALSCLYRHIKKNTPYGYLYVTLNSFDDLQNTEKEQFNSLCNKAYTSLLREEYSFHDPNMPTLGLVQSVQSFIVLGKSTQHYFLHLSLQELCAAVHLLTLSTDTQLEDLQDYLKGNVTSMVSVLSFFSAFGGWNKLQLRQILIRYTHKLFDINVHFQKRVTESEDADNIAMRNEKVGLINPYLMMFNHFYESQSSELCQFLPSVLDITDFPLSTRDGISLRYIIMNKKLKLLVIRNETFTVDLLKILAPALKASMPETLNIMHPQISDEGTEIIADLVKQTPLLHLCLYDVGMTEVGAELLSQTICGSQMESLLVGGNKIGNVGVKRLASSLINTEIMEFEVDNCGLTDDGLVSLSSALPKTKLTSLAIGGNYIGSRGLRALADAIVNTTDFSEVNVSSTLEDAILAVDIKQFLTKLQFHPTLSDVVMNLSTYNDLEDFISAYNITRKTFGLKEVTIEPAAHHEFPTEQY